MKKSITLFFLLLFSINNSNAQCTTGFNGNSTSVTIAKITGQTFQVSCTGQLTTIVFNPTNPNVDDLRGSGYFIGVRLKDTNGSVLANATINGASNTDQWFNGATITADFTAANLTLNANTTYIWEVFETSNSFDLFLFGGNNSNPYSLGNLIENNINRPGADAEDWTVNISAPPCNIPSIIATVPSSRCGSGNVNLSATPSAGSVQWFTSPTGGIALSNNSSYTISGNNITLNNLNATTTLYAEAVDGSCVSTSRSAVTATINQIPNTPASPSTFNFTSGQTLANISIQGDNIIWYDALTGGNVLQTSTALMNGVTYYASQTVNDCESERTAVQTILLVTISNTFTIGNNTNLITSGAVNINYSGGTLANNGTLSNPDGTLIFSAPVTFEGTGTTSTRNLTIANSGTSTLNNRINVSGTLAINNGNLDANNNLTLLSNASGTAVIAPVPSTSTITGKVTVQRFIPQGKRAFRFLTPGVTTDDFIANNWQLATHITGSTSGANGFDQTVSGNPSMFVYNNQQAAGSGWAPIANTDATNLQVGHGYRLLVRGDRTPTNITAASLPIMNTAVTVAATGTVAVGTVTLNASSTPAINNTTNTTTDGFSLIGNPYVNTVNWNDLTKTGLTDAYYAWDANMGTLAQRGRYVVFSSALGTNNMASTVNEFIQPGQAFFVKNTALGTAGSITFNEANKVGGSSISNQVFATPATLSRIDLQVFETNELALNGYPIDAAVAVFSDAFSNENEGLDIEKLSTGTEKIAFKNQNKNFAIETRALVTPTDELQIDLNEFVANKNYSFKTIFSDFDTNATPYLVDTYLNEVTALNNNQATIHNFQTNNEAASFANNRFKIVFQNTTLSNPTFTEAQVVLYPNPVTNNRFQLRLPVQTTGTVAVRVSNTLGQVVYQATHTADAEISIQMNQTLQEGIYLVQVDNQDFSVTKKITVKR